MNKLYQNKALLFGFVCVLYFIYLLFRPEILLASVLGFVFVLLCYKAKVHISTKVLYVFGALFLLFSFFNTRLMSDDGLFLYIRNAYLVSQHGYIRTPQMPYLFELLLGYIWRFAGLPFVSLTFGIVALLAIFLTLKLFDLLKLSKEEKFLGIGLLLSSPSFLTTAIHHFKTDIFLYCIACLVFINYVLYLRTRRFVYFALVSLLCAMGILVKITFAPILVALVLLEIVSLGFKKLFAALFLAAVPLALWVGLLGVCVPFFGCVNGFLSEQEVISPTVLEHFADLDRVNYCKTQLMLKDYDKFLPNKSLADILMQPVNFLFNKSLIAPVIQFNPGIFIYFGMFILFIYFLMNKKGVQLLDKKLFFIFFIFFITFFVSNARTVYWYLLPIFPIVCAYLSKKYLSAFGGYKPYLISMVWGSFIALFLMLFLYKYAVLGLNLDYIKSIYVFQNKVATYTAELDKASTNSYILDASIFGYPVLYTYMNDSDVKVINGGYLFLEEHFSPSKLTTHLKNNGFFHIAISQNIKDALPANDCDAVYVENIKTFISSETREVYANDLFGLYRIL